MNENDRKWARLVRAARLVPGGPEPEMPFGFATRVLARRKAAAAPSLEAVWEALSLRALFAFGAVALVCLALALDAVRPQQPDPLDVADGVVEIAMMP